MTKHSISPAAAGVALLIAAVGQSRAASVYDDDFSDGVRGAQWSGVIDDAAHLNLAEQGGRLDVLNTPGGTVNDDALYLSNFRLSTANDFVIRLDYSFTNYAATSGNGSAIAAVFGVGRDLAGTDSAAIGQGFATTPFLNTSLTLSGATVRYRTDDVTYEGVSNPIGDPTGTFEISYDAAGDDLTLRRVGSGITYTLADTVRQVWGAADLYVSFGGRGQGFTTTAGQAYLDNFTIVNGTVVPEPGMCLTVFSVTGLALSGRRLRSR